MKKIVWLASYPKSGNTWVRAFFTALLSKNKSVSNPIEDLIAPIASKRSYIEEYLLLETSELSNTEIDILRPIALECFADELPEGPFFMKAHDAYTYNVDNQPIFPSSVSLGAIYVVRNPLDVSVSYASHTNESLNKIVDAMNRPDYGLLMNNKGIRYQLPQKLLTWSAHVESWQAQKNIPVLIIRYEDMLHNPLKAFKSMVIFSGLSSNDTDIQIAIAATSFSNLKKLEVQNGFDEKPPLAEFFFRKGKAGTWKEELPETLVQQLINDHKKVMDSLGYLDENFINYQV